MNDKLIHTAAITNLMRSHRELKEIQQLEIARRLGYANPNFFSMMESGRCRIPIGKVLDIINAYEMDPKFALIVVRKIYPDIWNLMTGMLKTNRKFLTQTDSLERELDEVYKQMLEDAGISSAIVESATEEGDGEVEQQ